MKCEIAHDALHDCCILVIELLLDAYVIMYTVIHKAHEQRSPQPQGLPTGSDWGDQ